MRDILITVIIFGLLPFVLMRPYIGVLVWSWIGYMNPHRLAYGFAYSFPFAKIVGIAVLISFLFSKDKKKIPITPLTVVWAIFLLWITLSTLFALYPQEALLQFEKVMKIQLITILTISVISNKFRINWLIGVIAFSIGFYGIKGGVFSITHGGQFKIWGPDGSFIADNNHLALALLMVLPLFYYLQTIAKNKLLKMVLILFMVLIGISIVTSYSRGAFIGAFFVALFFWLKSRNKIIIGASVILLSASVYNFMPLSWHDRMGTIVNYEEDASALNRINAWKMTVNVASDRIFGGGFNLWAVETYRKYRAEAERKEDPKRSAHSIYFGVLGEHGWPGLFIFILIGIMTWRQCSKIIKVSKNNEELEWLANLMRMVQVSLIAYGSGGAFLSLAYFDLYWHFVAIAVIGSVIVKDPKLNKIEDINVKSNIESNKFISASR